MDNRGTDESPSTQGGPNKVPAPLQSILVHHSDDDDFFRDPVMRPRANTDPVSPRPRPKVKFDLPDIVVDDCSDNDEDSLDCSRPEEINKDLRNTDEGAFFVYKSPPRQRSNTCPMNMFSRHKTRKPRPPTPPPSEKLGETPRYPSWEKVSFSPHSLSSVEETREMTRDQTCSSDKKATGAKSNSPTRSRKGLHNLSNKTAKGKTRIQSDSPNASPKRSVPKISNGHVTSKSGSQRDHVIHSTA